MSKKLYLEALELLKQRIEAAEEPIEEKFREGLLTYDIVEYVDLVDNRLDDYLDLKINGVETIEPSEAIDAILEETICLALGVLSEMVRLKRDRDQLIERLADALVERRRFFAAESAEAPPEDESRPDAPVVVWTDFEAGLNAQDWDDEEDEEWYGDDPDFDDVYGDDDEWTDLDEWKQQLEGKM